MICKIIETQSHRSIKQIWWYLILLGPFIAQTRRLVHLWKLTILRYSLFTKHILIWSGISLFMSDLSTHCGLVTPDGLYTPSRYLNQRCLVDYWTFKNQSSVTFWLRYEIIDPKVSFRNVYKMVAMIISINRCSYLSMPHLQSNHVRLNTILNANNGITSQCISLVP